jgi:hypothetical protein
LRLDRDMLLYDLDCAEEMSLFRAVRDFEAQLDTISLDLFRADPPAFLNVSAKDG